MSQCITQLIKNPPLHQVVRALRRASSRGFVGACVWCGHGYSFSLQIESAHLKNCAEYQRVKLRPEEPLARTRSRHTGELKTLAKWTTRKDRNPTVYVKGFVRAENCRFPLASTTSAMISHM